MNRRVHELDDSWHFGSLLGSRIVTEAMTNFDVDTPLDDVLQYIHARLTLLENGDHKVGAFSMEAYTLIPSFTIDALKFETITPTFTIDARVEVTPTEASFTADALFMPMFSIDAIIERPGPDELWHQDFFDNDWLDSWGTPSTGIGAAYGYTNDAHEDASDKIEITQDVTDPDFPDYVGRYIEQDKTYYTHTVGDESLTNKDVTFLIENGRGIDGENIIRFEYRGPDNYLEYRIRGSGQLGADSVALYVDGVQRDFFDNQILGPKWGGRKYFQIQAVNNHVRARVWGVAQSVPGWGLEYRAASITNGRTAINWRGTSWVLVVEHPNGRPWTHDMKEWTVESVGAGRLLLDAFVQPYFTMDAELIRGGVFKVDAFVQPYFTMDAFLVITTEDSFTLDAVIPLTVQANPTVDAFIQPYFRIDAWKKVVGAPGSFTIDAAKVFTFEYSFTTDAAVERQIPGSFTADAITKVLDVTDTFVLQAWLAYGGDFDLDAYILGTRFLIDAVKKGEQTASFTIDSRVMDPELLREFFIDAYIPPPDGSFLMDAILKHAPDEYSHWDDFDNRTVASGLGVPSRVGRYTYSANEAWHDVTNGEWHYEDNLQSDRVYFADTSGNNIDRHIYWEWNRENNSGISIGWMYWYLTGDLYIRNRLNGSVYELIADGMDTGIDLNPGTTGWVGCRFEIYNNGKNAKWKMWNRASGEPELWQQWIDLTPYSLTDADVSVDAASQSWFGQGNPPFDHYLDNVSVWHPSGHPYVLDSDAIIEKTDQPGDFRIDADVIPTPFTIDAFVQPYFTIDARIWLGTTFSMDALIKSVQQFREGKITHDHVNAGGAGQWTHTPPADAKAIIVYGWGDSSDAPDSPTYGNKAMTSLESAVWYLTDLSGRDDDEVRTDAGSYRASLILSSFEDIDYASSQAGYPTVTMNDTIAHEAGRAVFQWASGGKADPWTNLAAYQVDGQGWLLDRGFNTNPITGWSRAATLGIDGVDTTSITAGVVDTGSTLNAANNYLFESANSGFAIGAFINKIFTIDAIFVKNTVASPLPQMDAIKHENIQASFTIDARIFDFGEQLYDFTMDAWIDPAVPTLRPTQWGWMEPGWQMWGEVYLEREQGVFDINAVLFATTTATFTIDAIYDYTFSIDAIIEKTQTFGEGYEPGWTHITHGPTTGTLDWTHTPQALGRAIFVHLSNNDDAASAVTYGGLSLTRYRNMVTFGRRNEIWFRDDISGRTDDTVSISGIGSTNTYATSTVIDNTTAFTVDESNGPSGWSGWGGTNDYTYTYDDAVSGDAYRVVLCAAGGEGGVQYEDQGVVAYSEADPHYSVYLSDDSTASSNASAVSLTIDGPDTGGTAAGFSTTGQSSSARYQGGVMASASPGPDPATGVNFDAFINPGGSYTIDAVIDAPHFTINAWIGSVASAELGEFQKGSTSLGEG